MELSRKHFFALALGLFAAIFHLRASVFAADNSFAIPAGLESTVDFWTRIFTAYSENEVVFHDPTEPSTIYSVMTIPESRAAAQTMINNEMARVINEYRLAYKPERVRSQRGAKEQFLISHKRSQPYLAGMKRIFHEENLPEELVYLPHVESAFDNGARSRMGALGIWQLMPVAVERFLRGPFKGDPRSDPYTSTRIAARMLKENYQFFGNWPLALTAYNYGPSAVARAIDGTGSSDLAEIIRKYKHPTFGYETQNFYAEFLATVDLVKRQELTTPATPLRRPFRMREIKIKRAVPIESLLKTAAVSQTQFFEWNRALDTSSKDVPAGYGVKLPIERAERFILVHRNLVDTPQASQLATAQPPRRRS